MAGLLGEPVGGRVGFQTRFERRVSSRTIIEVVTEGILTRRLQRDPELRGVGLLVFDEFHERSLHADLALALSLDVAAGLREDLRLLLMSATLDADALRRLLPGARVIACAGRRYPVTVEYAARPSQQPLARRVVGAVQGLIGETRGGLLVFLPGVAEIRRVREALRELPDLPPVVALYGDLSAQQQDRALRPAADGQRRIVLATDIAETSLTIEGIDAVIDSGLCKRPRFDPNSGMSRLETRPVSRASAEQRAGRAGRLGPGRCLRLWSEAEQRARPAHQTAEILRADLAPLALELLAWGVSDPARLAWVDPPPKGAWRQAIELLDRLGALAAGGGLNETGRAMARLPLHPRLGRLVLEAARRGDIANGAALAALLSEPDLLRGDRDAGVDLALRLPLLQRECGKRVRRMARQIERLVDIPDAAEGASLSPGELLAPAFPDRIAARHAGGRYRLANGRIACLDESDPLHAADWLVIADLDAGSRDGRIRRAVSLDPDGLPSLFEERIQEHGVLRWREREERFEAVRETRLDALVLSRRPDEKYGSRELVEAWRALFERKGLAWLRPAEEALQWLARVTSLHHWLPEADWPRLDEGALRARFDDWLAPWLSGVRTLKAARALDHAAMLKSLLDWERQQDLERLAPARLRVPSGTRARLLYAGDGSPPVLKVRIQELFGLERTPRVCDGRVAVRLHLLSPAQRPVQVTSDLAGFWDTVYPEVRKELRGRYPRHAWPEDPRAASPTRRVKPR